MKLFLPLIVAACLMCGKGSPEMNTVTLLGSASIANANYIIRRINGIWQEMAGGVDANVHSIAFGLAGAVYVGGEFVNAGGVAVNYIAKWDGAAWSALTTGVNTLTTMALAVGPDGSLYVGGGFATAGGVANTAHIAKWNGAAWSALVTGLSDSVNALAFGLDGTLYAGGDFDHAGAVTNVNGIAKWNGTAWSAMGVGVDGATSVAALAVASNGDLYAAGSFLTMNGVTVNRIAKWDGTAWSALGSGMDGVVYALAIGPDGSVYAGGNFTTAGGVAAIRVARWNGSSWSALGAGVNSTVWTLAIGPDGSLYVGGQFTAAGGMAIADRVAVWNGSSWSALDVDLPGSPTINVAAIRGTDLYLGFTTTGTATTSGQTPVTTVINVSTTRSYPRFTIKRAGGTSATLQSIQNLRSGQKLLFDYALADGEEVVIDLTPGNKTITSSFLGNAIDKVLPGCDFATFCLLPGANDIATYVSSVGSPTITAYMQWQDTFQSAAGALQ